LFSKYPTAEAYADRTAADLERAIQTPAFSAIKPKAFKPAVPDLPGIRWPGAARADVLVDLPGIGRKNRYVVLGTGLGSPRGVVVDTHVSRLSQRLD